MLFIFLCFFQFQEVKANKNPSQNILVVIAHPNPESFNHAILKVVQTNLEEKGHFVRIRDLYQHDFQPILSLEELKNYETQEALAFEDVLAEQEQLLWANNIIFIYPTWWWSPPAILKGYFDRVFTPVFAFKVDGGKVKGQLMDKKVVLIQTTGAEEDFIKENELDAAVKKLMGLGIFEFCGMEVLHHEFIFGVGTQTYAELKGVLEEMDFLIGELY